MPDELTRQIDQIDQRPPTKALLLYGLQWWAVIVPSVVILGLVAGKLHYPGNPAAQIAVLQKVFAISGLVTAAQVLFGHRLPIVNGPASVLLIGMTACAGATPESVYTGVFLGGAMMALLAATGLLDRLQPVFTPLVLIEIMLLIPFTLVPGILGLVFDNSDHRLFSLIFAPCFLAGLLLLGQLLKGVWKAAAIFVAMAGGTLIIHAITGFPGFVDPTDGTPPAFFSGFEFDPGIALAFLFCGMAIAVNEISSVQVIGQIFEADDPGRRTRRGVFVNGLSNMASGLTGVIGTVDYTTSAGIIASTGCASRFPFLPASGLLLACAFSKSFMALLLTLPGPVLGMLLFYVMAAQLAAGLRMMTDKRAIARFEDALTLAVPLLFAAVVSFLPPDVLAVIPPLIRPILGNAFVVGAIAVLIMEHAYNRSSKKFR